MRAHSLRLGCARAERGAWRGCAGSCVEGVHVCDGACAPLLRCTQPPVRVVCLFRLDAERPSARTHLHIRPHTACTRFHQIACNPIRAHAPPSEHTRASIRVRTRLARGHAIPPECAGASIRAHTRLNRSAHAIILQAPRPEHARASIRAHTRFHQSAHVSRSECTSECARASIRVHAIPPELTRFHQSTRNSNRVRTRFITSYTRFQQRARASIRAPAAHAYSRERRSNRENELVASW
jgi:hypothetical protein